MNEQKVVELTGEMNTVDSIKENLIKLGIKNSDIILVHSSLSSLGWVCGGAQAVVMALLQTVGNSGTLVMPAHTSEISDPAEWENPPVPRRWINQIYENMPAFDIYLSPTRNMGTIAELFRTLPQVTRSNHPQVSFAAYGKYSKEITDNHQLTPQFGMNSPLGIMYELNAKVILLGVGYEVCTSFHLAEVLSDARSKKKMGTAVMENGKRVWKWFEDFAYNSDEDFQRIGKLFDETGNVVIGKIGNAECRVFDLKTGVDFAVKWFLNNKF